MASSLGVARGCTDRASEIASYRGAVTALHSGAGRGGAGLAEALGLGVTGARQVHDRCTTRTGQGHKSLCQKTFQKGTCKFMVNFSCRFLRTVSNNEEKKNNTFEIAIEMKISKRQRQQQQTISGMLF